MSENAGAFVPRLQHTHLVSATYIGTNGSHYAFYFVALGSGTAPVNFTTPSDVAAPYRFFRLKSIP